jgi:serine/threonine protein kinase
MSNLSGILNNRYYIIKTVGHGGMTTVYKALDVKREKEVAVKVLAPYLVMDPVFKARFKREIQILEDFDHPNIVPILDHGEYKEAPYLVMPYFPEGTLADRMRSDSISSEECGRLIQEISSALEYEHNRGIVHRDIKPSNILLNKEGKAYLSDFDLIYMHDASQDLTGSAVIGTPAYMSPEQCSSGPIDARSDQYSLAVVLYQLTTGHLPFYAETPIAVALQQINEPLPNPREFNPNIPEPIEKVLLKALSKDPNKRYPTISAFNQAFQKALKISIITHQAEGSWTAKYYEITQVLSRIQNKAKGWFLRSALTKRNALLGVLLFLIILPAMIYTLFMSVKESSEIAQKATIAAIYTDVALQEGIPMGPAFMETAVMGTLEALNIDSEILASLGTPIPVTGGESSGNSEVPNEDDISEMQTLEASTPGENEITSSPTPFGSPSPTDTPVPTIKISSTQTTPGGDTPSPTPKVTVSVTPIPSSESSPTRTATPSKTPIPSKTPTPSETASPTTSSTATPTPTPTKDVCSDITLSGFDVKAVDVSYVLVNESSNSITINMIELTWPTGNQSLKSVKIGGETVWNLGDDGPPTLITDLDITVPSQAQTQIKFTFKRAAALTGYSLTLTLSNGCEKLQEN